MFKYDPRQLRIGTKIELEHTNSLRVAEKIAKDHLREFPNYYTELVKMESRLKYMQPKKTKVSYKRKK